MNPPTTHRERTRLRILDHAFQLFNRHGYNGVGIDDIMAAAGLTRGGFYAHFASKEDLLAAVTTYAPFKLGVGLRDSSKPKSSAAPSNWTQGFIGNYLRLEHCEGPENGCNMPAVTPDVARAGPKVREAYSRNIRGLARNLARDIKASPSESRSRALAAIALCVGGVMLGRAVDDKRLRNEILTACRNAAGREIEPK